eukprot:CAMPEP_0176255776 /NCGR_PEP_ID=MMETSP0121_2-20121125/37211_1 /TAXON_ID=160619 /ORGANISM="Kryptoperidinium foliaceum, Strain CCMP 1326" /LENGTH=143 /DNA_ID=CAMNT_0017595605 /DNA_START=1 /DNA_END=432 /DNA_ORIENTATION=-
MAAVIAAAGAEEDEEEEPAAAIDPRAWGVVASRVAAVFAAAATDDDDDDDELPVDVHIGDAAKAASPAMTNTTAPGSAVPSERFVGEASEAGEASDDELAHRPARRAFSGLLSARATVPEDRAKISALQGVLAGVFAEASAAE